MFTKVNQFCKYFARAILPKLAKICNRSSEVLTTFDVIDWFLPMWEVLGVCTAGREIVGGHVRICKISKHNLWRLQGKHRLILISHHIYKRGTYCSQFSCNEFSINRVGI